MSIYNTTTTTSMVVFVRTTPAIWEKVADEDKVSNTLYFVADKGAEKGELYLGSTLISGGNSVVSIGDLEDVIISSTGIDPSSVLAYNSESGKWEDKPFAELLADEIPIFNGSTSGLVPVPTEGQGGLFLKGDGTWANPIDGIDTIVEQKVKDEVSGLIDGAPDTLDSFKEVADWIAEHEDLSDLTGLENRVSELEDVLVNGKDSGETDPESGEHIIIPSIVDRVDAVEDGVKVINQKIENIYNSVYWQELGLEDETENA